VAVIERYKLYFEWIGLKYNKDVASFKDAWFHGPVLQRAAKINSNDYIDLDFSSQNFNNKLFLVDSYYIAKLRWKDVEYREGKVMLKGCKLTHNKAGTLRELKDGFSFLIDCGRHESYMHHKTLVYPSWVMNEEKVII